MTVTGDDYSWQHINYRPKEMLRHRDNRERGGETDKEQGQVGLTVTFL